MQNFQAIWRYRGFIIESAKRDFNRKHKGTVLGAAWMALNPFAWLVIYTLVFSAVMEMRIPGVEGGMSYSVYLCSGLITWGFFSEVALRALNIFREYERSLKKIYFPWGTLPIIITLSASLTFSILLIIFVFFLVAFDIFPGFVFATLLPVLLIQTILALGLGMTLGVVSIFFKDIANIFGLFIAYWFWLTPIVYVFESLPEQFRSYILFNPLFSLMDAYHGIFVFGRGPQWISLLYPLILGLFLCALAAYLISRWESDILDEI